MKLSELAPGSRFRYPDCGRSALLLGIGAGGARIVYDDSQRKVAFKTSAEDDVTFDAPGRAVMVSAGTDVILTEAPANVEGR